MLFFSFFTFDICSSRIYCVLLPLKIMAPHRWPDGPGTAHRTLNIKQRTNMRSRTANWFECKIRYEKTMDDGLQKKVTEAYVVDALSFSEAEERIIEEMSSYISGEFNVTDIKKAAYGEIFFDDSELADRWYKAKLQFITIDEKTEKEKRSNINYLVQAGSFNGAVKNIEEVMGGTAIDYVIASVAETTLMDVFEHVAKVKEEKPEFEEVKE